MTYEMIEIRGSKVELSTHDGEVFSIRIQGKDLNIDNFSPLGRGKPDSKYNTMDYKIPVVRDVPVEISIINWGN